MSEVYLDHVLIAVHDLGRAATVFSQGLGFTLTPEGVHPGRGTHNRLIVFGPEYLELIAVRDPSEGVFRPTMGRFLDSREGLYMFALGTDAIGAAVAQARARGINVDDPHDGAREASGGALGYTWSFAGVSAADTPGSETFFIQHNHTVEERYTQPANASVHANGALGIHHVALAVRDADESAGRWQEAFGFVGGPAEEIAGRGIRRARLVLGNCRLDFVSPLRSGALSRFLERNGEAPYELALRVGDIEATGACLRERGVPTSAGGADADGASIGVDSTRASGVLLRFVQPGG
ncbi:MAG: VOC family protein [Chloroflexi bacterium]|nr:VOC family protein [Chloroflexota bacterium]